MPLTPEERKAHRQESSRKWYQANKAGMLEAVRVRRATTDYDKDWVEANRDKVNERNREWKRANADAVRESGRRYREDNKEAEKIRGAKYRATHTEIGREQNHTRRARIRGNETEKFTDLEMIARWGADCHICGEPVDLDAPRKTGAPGWERGLHREHVVPVSAGGGNILDNCKPAHGLCNMRKN